LYILFLIYPMFFNTHYININNMIDEIYPDRKNVSRQRWREHMYPTKEKVWVDENEVLKNKQLMI